MWGEVFFGVSDFPSFRFAEFQILFVFMRVAILAQFPIHILPEFAYLGEPKQHYATWLPQLAQGFGVAIANGEWRTANGSPRRLKEVEDSGFRIENSEDAPVISPLGASFPPRTPESLIQNPTGLEIHWITLSTEVVEPRVVEYLKQTFHILPTATSKRASTLFKLDRASIRSVLQEIQPDLVHGWGTEDVYALSAVTSGYPNMVSMAGLLSHYVLKTKMHPRDYFQAALELYVLRKADLITVETEWGRKVLLRRTKRPIELVEYGVRPHFYDIPWTPDPARPVALFIGSVHPRKGIQDAVAAMAHPQLKDCELRVAGAGSGEWVDALRRRATPNVAWLGQIAPEQTAQELSKAWCLVLPTRCDTSPNVVKEARVIGLPVITTSAGGQSDYIHDGENGFIVPCGQPGVLAERLERLLKDYNVCRAMGAARHEEAREHFRPERTAALLLQIYKRGVASNG